MKFTTVFQSYRICCSVQSLVLSFTKCYISRFSFYNFCLLYFVYISPPPPPPPFTPLLPASLPQPPFAPPPLWGVIYWCTLGNWLMIYTPPPSCLSHPPLPHSLHLLNLPNVSFGTFGAHVSFVFDSNYGIFCRSSPIKPMYIIKWFFKIF